MSNIHHSAKKVCIWFSSNIHIMWTRTRLSDIQGGPSRLGPRLGILHIKLNPTQVRHVMGHPELRPSILWSLESGPPIAIKEEDAQSESECNILIEAAKGENI